jgi:type IV secretory pathway VirB6-like protein
MKEVKKNDCPACRLTRVFLLLAVPIMMMMWFKPELPLLKSINLTYAFANLVGFACLCVIAYKAYHEFWLPARKAKSRAALEAVTAANAPTSEEARAQVGLRIFDSDKDVAEAEAEARIKEKNLN